MASKKGKYVIGVDVGGTKILTVLLDKQFEVVAEQKEKVDANKGEKHFFHTVYSSIDAVLKSAHAKMEDVRALGVGCPGMIQMPQGIIRLSPNLSFLKDYPLKNRLIKQFGVPVAVENDVNAGLYGEQQFGAAAGVNHVAGIFLGTGVGGALIFNGRLYHGATGGAGEIGHTFLSLPTFLEGMAREGTVESNLGRLRIASDAALLMMKQLSPKLFEMVGYDVKKIKSGTIAKAVKAGDTALEELLVHKAKLLGIAMANIVNLLNPSLIVLGGGLIEALGDIIVPAARDSMRQYAMPPLVEKVKVVSAKLKDYATAKGAAKLALEAAEEGRASR